MPFSGFFALLRSLESRAEDLTTGYVADANGDPILPPGMREHLSADLDRTIDDF